MKTGLITSDTYQNHNTGDGHPEKMDRVTVVIDNFKKLNNKNLIWKKPSKFDKSLLEITHNPDYINFVEKSFPKKGLSFLDGDTIVSPGSKEATSDARFIRKITPCLEFGLVGKTMHKVDEAVSISDLKKLTKIYSEILKNYF